MKRIALLLLAPGLAAAVFLVPAQASTPKLIGTVGPGFTITLKKGTAKVKTLKAGKYTFVELTRQCAGDMADGSCGDAREDPFLVEQAAHLPH